MTNRVQQVLKIGPIADRLDGLRSSQRRRKNTIGQGPIDHPQNLASTEEVPDHGAQDRIVGVKYQTGAMCGGVLSGSAGYEIVVLQEIGAAAFRREEHTAEKPSGTRPRRRRCPLTVIRMERECRPAGCRFSSLLALISTPSRIVRPVSCSARMWRHKTEQHQREGNDVERERNGSGRVADHDEIAADDGDDRSDRRTGIAPNRLTDHPAPQSDIWPLR